MRPPSAAKQLVRSWAKSPLSCSRQATWSRSRSTVTSSALASASANMKDRMECSTQAAGILMSSRRSAACLAQGDEGGGFERDCRASTPSADRPDPVPGDVTHLVDQPPGALRQLPPTSGPSRRSRRWWSASAVRAWIQRASLCRRDVPPICVMLGGALVAVSPSVSSVVHRGGHPASLASTGPITLATARRTPDLEEPSRMTPFSRRGPHWPLPSPSPALSLPAVAGAAVVDDPITASAPGPRCGFRSRQLRHRRLRRVRGRDRVFSHRPTGCWS